MVQGEGGQESMFKFALALGISYEWLAGPGVTTLRSMEFAAVRTLCATLVAWMILETIRVLIAGAMSFPDRSPNRR
jgi:uncharacterized membrane protein (DUF441 family)